MKIKAVISGLIFLSVTTFCLANNEVDKKLSGILQQVETKLKVIDSENKSAALKDAARAKAFSDMNEAVKSLAPPAKLTLAESKKLREGLLKLTTLHNNGMIHAPDFEKEITALGKLDLSDFPQTKAQLAHFQKQIAARKSSPRSTNMVARGVAPAPSPKQDPAPFQSMKTVTLDAIKANKSCPSCDELAKDAKAFEKDKAAGILKRDNIKKQHEATLKKDPDLTAKARAALDHIIETAQEAFDAALTPSLVTKDGKEYSGKVRIDGKTMTAKEFANHTKQLMMASVLHRGKGYSKEGMKAQYKENVGSWKAARRLVLAKGAQTSLFTRLYDYMEDAERPASWQLRGEKGERIEFKLNVKSENLSEALGELDWAHNEFGKIARRSENSLPDLLAGTNPELLAAERQVQIAAYKSQRYDDCRQCRRDAENEILGAKEPIGSPQLRNKIDAAAKGLHETATFSKGNRPKSK